jgi:hypothetical protein
MLRHVRLFWPRPLTVRRVQFWARPALWGFSGPLGPFVSVLAAPLHIAQPFGRGIAVAMEPLHAWELFAEAIGAVDVTVGSEFLAVIHECRISTAYAVTLQQDYTAGQCAFHAAPESLGPTVQEGFDAHFIPVRRVEIAGSSLWQAATDDLTQPAAHQVVVKSGELLTPVAVVKIRIRQTEQRSPPQVKQEVEDFHEDECYRPTNRITLVRQVHRQ